jgi:hypothetical protein
MDEIHVPDEETRIRPQSTVVHRLTIVSTVYHQVHGGEAQDLQTRCSRVLTTDEQLYQRLMKSTEKPSPIDLGWLKGLPIGLIHIDNRDKQAELLVYFGASEALIKIPPLESFFFTPAKEFSVQVSSNIGGSKFMVSIIPG